MYKFIFFVPVDYADAVKQAVFKAGAGQLGGYTNCSFETLGKGQFCPSDKNKPFIGSPGQIEVVDELKVEMLCEKDLMKEVIKAFKEAHPYEEPAFDIIELVNDFN